MHASQLITEKSIAAGFLFEILQKCRYTKSSPLSVMFHPLIGTNLPTASYVMPKVVARMLGCLLKAPGKHAATRTALERRLAYFD